MGFEILDLGSQRRGWLAHVNQPSGTQVGKYRVNINDLEAVGVQAIIQAVETCDVVVIDEIGPMELFSEKFKKTMLSTLETKLIIAVVHWKAQDKLVVATKSRQDAKVFRVTPENRDILPEEIAVEAEEFLRFSHN